jgi:hypothetical protein
MRDYCPSWLVNVGWTPTYSGHIH